MGMLRPGECWTLNGSEFPSDGVASSLSRVLLPPGSVPERYYLSPKACAGILRRAAARGRALPGQLRRVLLRVAGLESTQDT